MSKFMRSVSIIILALGVVACSREPNQEELQQLYSAKVNNTNALAEKIMQQKGQIIQIKNFEKIDCNKIADSKDYLCRANISVSLPFLGEQKNTAEMKVTKGENGWVILD